MKWILTAAILALAACGGEDAGGRNGGPPCYEYMLNPNENVSATHCTYENIFCWWIPTNRVDSEFVDCGARKLTGCLSTTDNGKAFFCGNPQCETRVINNPGCCEGTVRHSDGTVGPWDRQDSASCE